MTKIINVGCRNKNKVHNWKLKEEYVIKEGSLFFSSRYYRVFIVQCKDCGEITKMEISLGNYFSFTGSRTKKEKRK